ncbi:MAG: pyridoxamine 5'-phosphate oxidase family protein [Pseudomonadales bacterium]|nr:pyridoxamine 5'-phosphate oxidase family protein [Pseudomonadales bacterium]
MDPVINIKNDRAEARRLEDSNADICFLAVADSEGQVSVRTLVLRDIVDNRFVIFVNKTSPKYKALTTGGNYQLLLWYTALQRQYRISGTINELETDIVRTNWYRRPKGSKLLDYVYQEMGDQSSEIESRQILVDKINQLKADHSIDEMEPPAQVAGIELIADRIEMLDLNREDRIHDRQLYRLEDGKWSRTTLIP